jgi:hypothetical protein
MEWLLDRREGWYAMVKLWWWWAYDCSWAGAKWILYQAAFWLFCFAAVRVYDGEAGPTFNKR